MWTRWRVQAAKAAPMINLILKDVETFTDKIARHPESIGVGRSGAAGQRVEGRRRRRRRG